MSHHKDDIRIDKAENTSLETENSLVGVGAYNSSCKSSDNGKGVGVMYQQQGAVKIHNGRIIGCDSEGYIVRHCSDASKGSPFKYDKFYFYNEKYFRTHNINHSHAHAFIDIGIRNNKHVFCYYGKEKDAKNLHTHNGIFHSFTYKDPTTKKSVTSSDFSTFLSLSTSPHLVSKIVYYHYVEEYDNKKHQTVLRYVKTSASDIKHYGEVPNK